ncbi:MAG: hypothetical protein HYS27_22910 [Deltaproteobacteria bacterium]|nr:hypothetical protein [Deltaproteobacteria bacterium]
MTTTATVSLFFTEGPCDDDDAPDFIRDIRVQRSLRARARPAHENLDDIHGNLFMDLSRAFAKPNYQWTEAEDDALCAIVDELLLCLCNGALLHHDRDERPRGFIRAVSAVN